MTRSQLYKEWGGGLEVDGHSGLEEQGMSKAKKERVVQGQKVACVVKHSRG